MWHVALVHGDVVVRVGHENRAHRRLRSAIEASKPVLDFNLLARRNISRSNGAFGSFKAFVLRDGQEFAEGFVIELSSPVEGLKGIHQELPVGRGLTDVEEGYLVGPSPGGLTLA